MSKGGSVTFTDCTYRGTPLGQGKPAVISDDRSLKEIQQEFVVPVSASREFDWVEFRFENTAIDTLSLIIKAHSEIKKITLSACIKSWAITKLSPPRVGFYLPAFLSSPSLKFSV